MHTACGAREDCGCCSLLSPGPFRCCRPGAARDNGVHPAILLSHPGCRLAAQQRARPVALYPRPVASQIPWWVHQQRPPLPTQHGPAATPGRRGRARWWLPCCEHPARLGSPCGRSTSRAAEKPSRIDAQPGAPTAADAAAEAGGEAGGKAPAEAWRPAERRLEAGWMLLCWRRRPHTALDTHRVDSTRRCH